jgi:N-methylhydantoinase A
MRVGVEVGGTFTDLVAIGAEGLRITKVPSVPTQPDEGAFNAILESGVAINGIEDLAHGSTIATNAVLERKGWPIAFVTTEGFRDILLMQRHNRTNIYDLAYRKPQPVMDRKDMFEVPERIAGDGSVVSQLDEAAVIERLVPALAVGGYAAVALCLLNSYLNPAHEERLAEILRSHLPDTLVTPSHQVTREFREYERATTTTLAAYVQPVIDRYLGRFESRLAENGFRGRLSVMQSNGGRLPADGMRRNAVTALLSGPAAGVVGAMRQAERSGFQNLITLDIGGTSTDVCLVTDGKPQLTTEFEIDALPVRTPVLDINTVGAGGGSIIWIDEGGMLRVGPQSAGADPGPVCYGRGGERPTITDAHVVRGTIRPQAFLGGRMMLDAQAAHGALAPIGKRLGLNVDEVADSAIRVANANIVRAIQLISTQRGKDPRDYAMVAFGGAGPLHATQVAADLGVRTIVVPPNAGVISAFGLIASDFVQFESLTRRVLVDEGAAEAVKATYVEMRDRAVEQFKRLGLGGDLRFSFIADMRFVGQAFEVPVEMAGKQVAELTTRELRTRFAEAHHRVYLHGQSDSQKAVEIVSFRLSVTAPLGAWPELKETHDFRLDEQALDVFDDRRRQTGVAMSRSMLAQRRMVGGPALFEDPTSTVFVPAGWRAMVDDKDNMIIQRD